jgi:hypothetical protein
LVAGNTATSSICSDQIIGGTGSGVTVRQKMAAMQMYRGVVRMGIQIGARPYFERALAILTARLGPDHPHTQTVRRNLVTLTDSPAD